MSSPPVPQEFLLVAKRNTHFAHIRAIDAGGGGEVHEVLVVAPPATLIL